MITEEEIDREIASWPFGELGRMQARNRIMQRRMIQRRRK